MDIFLAKKINETVIVDNIVEVYIDSSKIVDGIVDLSYNPIVGCKKIELTEIEFPMTMYNVTDDVKIDFGTVGTINVLKGLYNSDKFASMLKELLIAKDVNFNCYIGPGKNIAITNVVTSFDVKIDAGYNLGFKRLMGIGYDSKTDAYSSSGNNIWTSPFKSISNPDVNIWIQSTLNDLSKIPQYEIGTDSKGISFIPITPNFLEINKYSEIVSTPIVLNNKPTIIKFGLSCNVDLHGHSWSCTIVFYK